MIFKASLEDVVSFDQLFINGEQQIKARYPNYDSTVLVYHGYAADAIAPERINTWSKPDTRIVRQHAEHFA